MDVVGAVLRGAQGAHEEDHPVQVGPLGDGIVCLDVIHGDGIHAVLQVLHGGGDAAGHALVIDVDLHVLPQIAALGDLGQHRLPRLHGLAVLDLVIGILKDPLLLEEVHIRADVVEAEVQIVTVGSVGDHGVVAHGGKDPAHGGVLLLGEVPLHGLVQVVGVVKDVVHLLHQDARGGQDHVHHQGEAHDHEQAADRAPDDLAQGALLFALRVEHLADHRPAGEYENQDHADDRHAPVDVVDRLVGKEDVDQIVLAAVVGDGLQAGEDLEQVGQETDDPAEAFLNKIAELEDGRIEDALQDGAQGIAQKIAQTAPNIAQHLFSPPFRRSALRSLRFAVSVRAAKTPYRFVAPPLQNETVSLGFILGHGGFTRSSASFASPGYTRPGCRWKR